MSDQPKPDSHPPPPTGDFSLVCGGLLFRVFQRARLCNESLELIRRRMVVLPLALWLPLLVLTFIDGNALGGVKVPFLFDVETWTKFLIALPVLIYAEVLVHERLGRVTGQFTARGLVTKEELPRFHAALSSAARWRDSTAAELILLVTVLISGPLLWHHGMALQGATWYADVEGDRMTLTMAGKFFVHVSSPAFQFILLRWLFRLFIWSRFLWQVSRLKLAIMPLHPDCAGGLGFLGASGFAFCPILFALGVLLAGFVATRVLFAGQHTLDFRFDAVILVTASLVMVLGPLLFFSRALGNARRAGSRKYGVMAAGYVQTFDARWLSGGAPAGEELLGSADVQSLADLSGSYDAIREMSVFPFGLRAVIQLAITTAAPLAPLALTVVPASEILDHFLKVIL